MDVQENRGNVTKLLTFLKGMNSLKKSVVTDVSKQPWSYKLSDLPQDTEYEKVRFHDEQSENDESTSEDYLVKIQKPVFEKCPEPDESFKKWLKLGWDDYLKQAEHLENIKRENNDNESAPYSEDDESQLYEAFEDDEQRVTAYEKWLKDREIWQSRQKSLEKVNALFLDFFDVYQDLAQNSEVHELMIANGLLTLRDDPNINHPILLQKVKIEFDDRKNTISVVGGNSNSQLYDLLFSKINNVSSEAFQKLQQKLDEASIHPLDRKEVIEFLEIAAHSLSPKGKFLKENEEILQNSQDELFIRFKPMLILQNKQDGLPKFIDRTISDIEEGSDIPSTLLDLTGKQAARPLKPAQELSVEQELAEVGGEDPTILLAKPANKEQLEIAREIQHSDKVLVQGPPGTGKTHTIANLIGNFLAQGQSILVSSYSSKALSVLKDKLPEELQSMCVAVFDDSNKDMERSIDGISEHMSNESSEGLRAKAKEQANVRDSIISKLSETRQRIYEIKYKEYKPLIFNGNSMSPTDAAKFVSENAEKLDYIPGKIKLDTPLPLSYEELSELYKTNTSVNSNEEKELAEEVPDPGTIASPKELSECLAAVQSMRSKIFNYISDIEAEYDEENQVAVYDGTRISLQSDQQYIEPTEKLQDFLSKERITVQWELDAVVDGKNGESSGLTKRWEMLCDQITATAELSNELATKLFGKEITITQTKNSVDLPSVIAKMRDKYLEKGKIGKLARLVNKQFDAVESMVKINGQPMKNAEDCDLVLGYLNLQELRATCANYWQDLICEPRFDSLNNGRAPELQASQYVNQIKKRLDWYDTGFVQLKKLLQQAGFEPESIFAFSYDQSNSDIISEIFAKIEGELPFLCQLQLLCIEYQKKVDKYEELTAKINELGIADICKKLQSDWKGKDTNQYSEDYQELQRLYSLYAVQATRKKYLEKLSAAAPVWAEKIKYREDKFGLDRVPENIEEAWEWKQYSQKLAEITAEPFEKLQRKNSELSKEYRKITAQLAETEAWRHLLEKTECNPDLQKNLQSWKLLTKKIGKGKGKNAGMYRNQAQQLMIKCQEAVPAWIMNLSNVTNNMVPGKNKFDVLIIDEASQADLSALPVLYLAKKVIIVGDDKQVSPTGSFTKLDELNSLAASTIKDVLPNWALFSANTSLYDIAATICQPLMLREHFRCVPEIIGFSNRLSYDGKIKPLRDSSSSDLLPAMVNYRVDGHRDGRRKTNEVEANTIVSLIQAMLCVKQYKDKTIGVISLNGKDQAKLIQNKLVSKLNLTEYQRHQILCGTSAEFQGDERDVVFLSMIDSNEKGSGPIRKMGAPDSQPGKDLRRRYNVAVSRAKDQLWVVNSLNYANDLQEGDVRKELLEYASNPHAFMIEKEKIEREAESPFEAEVAKALAARGYKLVQQWPVGAYRIDMVAIDGNRKVAIECDGERWHSSEEQIRNDMERQTILERLGWHFVRLRGSEYYGDAEAAIDRVCKDLGQLGINPNHDRFEPQSNTKLLDELKRIAADNFSLSEGEHNSLKLFTDENFADIKETSPVASDKPEPSLSQDEESPYLDTVKDNSISLDKELFGEENEKLLDQPDEQLNKNHPEEGFEQETGTVLSIDTSVVEAEKNALKLEKLVFEFNKLKPGYYDLLLPFYTNPSLMEDLSITTKQELLDLCKKINLPEKVHETLTFLTGTRFRIGSVDEKEWLKGLLKKFVDENIISASNKISEETGFSSLSIRKKIEQLLPNWVNSDKIVSDPYKPAYITYTDPKTEKVNHEKFLALSKVKDTNSNKEKDDFEYVISIFQQLSPGLYSLRYVFNELKYSQRKNLGLDSVKSLLDLCKNRHIENSITEKLTFEEGMHFRIGTVNDKDWLVKLLKQYTGQHKHATFIRISIQTGLSTGEVEELINKNVPTWVNKKGIIEEPAIVENDRVEKEQRRGIVESSESTNASKKYPKDVSVLKTSNPVYGLKAPARQGFNSVFESFARNNMYQPKQINVSLLNSYNEYCQEIGRLDAKENSLANFRTKVLYSDMVIQSDKDSYRFYRLTWASHYKEQLVSVISRLPNGKHDLNDVVQQNAQLFEEMNIVTGLELAEICIKLYIKRYINSELTFSLTSSPTLIKYNPKYPLSGDSPRVPTEKDKFRVNDEIVASQDTSRGIREFAAKHIYKTPLTQDLFEEYKQFCDKRSLVACQGLLAFQDALIKDSQIVISKDDLYKFIDPAKISKTESLSRLIHELRWYHPGPINLERIYDALPRLMNDLDLSDEFELYTLCEKQGIANKYREESDARLTFIEEPYILLSYVKLDDWYKDIFESNVGSNIDQLFSSISRSTGVSKDFLLKYANMYCSNQIQSGVIQR